MNNYDISVFLKPQNNYCVTGFLHQHWNSKSFSYRDTPRQYNGILFVTQGKIEFVTQSESLLAASGDMVFLPKGSYYDAVIKPEFGDTQDYLINFEADMRLPIDFPLAPLKILHTEQHKYIDIFELFIEFKIRNSINDFRAKSHFYSLLDNIVKDCKNESNSQRDLLLKKAQELLSGTDDIPVSEIAQECGVSESGLRSIFGKAYGISPMQYRMNIKINRAKFMLQSTDMSVYDIADALNFYDEAYFCKVFRKYVGCSPKRYVMSKRI